MSLWRFTEKRGIRKNESGDGETEIPRLSVTVSRNVSPGNDGLECFPDKSYLLVLIRIPLK